MTRKRRSLVLTTESARHPFRMSLRAGALRMNDDGWSDAGLPPRNEWRDVLSTYVATFVVMTVFLA